MADKPYYPHRAIASPNILAKTLGVNLPFLKDSSKNASNSYTNFLIPTKSKIRSVYEPKINLKYIQKKINKEILSKVEYPKYLMGGISDPETPRDYIENSKHHLRKESLINLDIEDFYHSIEKVHVINIFKQLFKFNDEVSEILANLVTLEGKVPQGGCTSSYIANLVFFNSEYSIVSKFRNKGIAYTRLLDDITLSSERNLSNKEKESAILQVSGMITKYGLKLKNKKTRIEDRKNPRSKYEVTGAWVRFGEPKIKKKERNSIRHAVYICEISYGENPTTEEYHKLWNKTSGKIAKLARFNHKNEAAKLRKRLSTIYPYFDDAQAKTLETKVRQLVYRKEKNRMATNSAGVAKYVLRLYHNLGILSRTHPQISKPLKLKLRGAFGSTIKNEYY